MPFGDLLSLFTLLVLLAGAGLYLRMVGKEKDRRDRHILRRYYELGQEEEKKARETEDKEKSGTRARRRQDQDFVSSRQSAEPS